MSDKADLGKFKSLRGRRSNTSHNRIPLSVPSHVGQGPSTNNPSTQTSVPPTQTTPTSVSPTQTIPPTSVTPTQTPSPNAPINSFHHCPHQLNQLLPSLLHQVN